MIVPDVVGLQLNTAEPTLIAAGLTVGTITFQESFVVPAGQVMSQTPIANTSAPVGTPVNLVVSAGVTAAIVPEIVGLTRAEAITLITDAGLTVGVVVEQFSPTVPPGIVLSQNPLGGSTVLPGTAVGFSVSIGAGTVTVPGVVGLQQAVAEAAITAAGLAVGEITTLPSPNIPVGQVMAQTPGAGATVTLGTAVNLTVSAGTTLVLVPQLVGLTQAAAANAIYAATLELGTVTQRASPTVSAGIVMEQDPLSGVPVSPGSFVDLVVSTGPAMITVPNVVGLGLVAAGQVIVNAGLTVGTVIEQFNPVVPPGQVFQQNPAAGALLQAGGAVNLVVSTGTGLATVPNVIGLSLAAAEDAIIAAGLVVGSVTEQPSATATPGTVITQQPVGNVAAPVGSAVDLVVAVPIEQIQVPNVVGLQEAAARAAITVAGLTVGNIVRRPDPVVLAGQVISQNPPAGALVQTGASVNLVISTGAGQAIVPDVVGLTSTAAQSAILAAGLTVGAIVQQEHPAIPAGEVISQNPPAGTDVAEGTAVNLVVSAGTTTVFVPNVVGLTLNAAQTAISGAGLSVGTITEQTSPTVPAGSVISQDPPADTAVAPGTGVNLVVSTGATMVTVPNVVGMTRTLAENAIEAAGLIVGAVTSRFTTTVPARQVLEQDPAAGASVTAGSSVDLVISTRTQPVTVPNVVGLPLPAANAMLAAANLAAGTVTERPSETIPINRIISQSPGAGSTVDAGTRINLIVSTGPVGITVPDVVGLTLSQAEVSLTLAGFIVGDVTGGQSDMPVSQVISQFPAGGSMAAGGSAVDLVISAGPSPATVPDLIGLELAAARALVESSDFVVGLVTSRPDPVAPAGIVIDQQPSPGVLAPAGAEINIVVSEGIVLVQVPDVIGLQLEDAEAALLKAGLTVGAVTQQQSAQPVGQVLSQLPVGGFETHAGATIDLVISQGPATLPRPLNLTASQGTFTEWVRVSWSPVEGAIGYQIRKSLTPSFNQSISLATTGETVYDDTNALPPDTALQSPGCFAPAEEVVVFNNNYYWVQAISADAQSEFTGPAVGYRGLAGQSEFDMARVKALPSRGAAGRKLYARTGDNLALRLSDRDGIDRASVWGAVSLGDGTELAGLVTWNPRADNEDRDGWVVYEPHEPFAPGVVVKFTAGAINLAGFEIIETRHFIVQAQPQTDYASDEVRLVPVAPHKLPALPEAVALAYSLEPQHVYGSPKRVWLPVPEPLNPDELEVYVLIADTRGAQWCPARSMSGFMHGETVRAEIEGVRFIGFDARHGATVRLGTKTPEPAAGPVAGHLTQNLLLVAAALTALTTTAILKLRRRSNPE